MMAVTHRRCADMGSIDGWGSRTRVGLECGVGRRLPVRVAPGTPRVHSPCVASSAAHSLDSSKIAASSIPRVVRIDRWCAGRSSIPRGRRDRDLSYVGPLGATRFGCEESNLRLVTAEVERQERLMMLERGESNLRLVTAMGRGKGQIGLTIYTEQDRVAPQGEEGTATGDRTVSRARRMRACANEWDEARVSVSSV
jgi:hypothetical protein